MSNVYSEYRYYSPLHDADMVRLSMTDMHSQEFWTAIPETNGTRYLERRDDALAAIQQAIELGEPPGEVRVR